MKPRLIAMAALFREVAIPASVLVGLVAFGSAGIDHSGAAPIVDHIAPLLAANAKPADIIPAIKPAPIALATVDAVPASQAAEATPAVTPASHQAEPEPIVTAALTDSSETLRAETPPEPEAKVAMATPEPANPAAGPVEVQDECLAADPCVDRYLWTLYQRTPKEDAISIREKKQVTVKKKGRMVSVTRTVSKLTDEDFSWKDPKAAEVAGMPMADYVIGGVDREFKLKLFQMLHAAEAAGLSPGITSAFRDDYRQSIASGLKAANNRSYHGGSLHGGYGHGLAADIVSVNGATRSERQASSETLWKWVDAHGKEFGIGRPYLGKDPPHVGPIDGKEYADHRLGVKAARAASAKPARAASAAKPHKQVALRVAARRVD
jgi:D-alanyl-D-alanine carboxypeptidase